MPSNKDLPYLIDLLEDDSDVVRQHVIRQLAAFGSGIERELRNLSNPLDESRLRMALFQVEDFRRNFGAAEAGHLEDFVIPGRLFNPGQVVIHKRYSYRGVIVDYDETCQADAEWYAANAVIPPSREQPWYFVLVHLTSRVTYAAQSSLILDDTGQQVIHPLVPEFFSSCDKGFYLRNHRTWPRLEAGSPPKG